LRKYEQKNDLEKWASSHLGLKLELRFPNFS